MTGDTIDTLVSIAHRAATSTDEFTRSPERRKNQEKAAEIADLLKHESGRHREPDAARIEVCKHRSVWTRTRTPSLPSWPESDGWMGSIAKVLNGACRSASFSSTAVDPSECRKGR